MLNGTFVDELQTPDDKPPALSVLWSGRLPGFRPDIGILAAPRDPTPLQLTGRILVLRHARLRSGVFPSGDRRPVCLRGSASAGFSEAHRARAIGLLLFPAHRGGDSAGGQGNRNVPHRGGHQGPVRPGTGRLRTHQSAGLLLSGQRAASDPRGHRGQPSTTVRRRSVLLSLASCCPTGTGQEHRHGTTVHQPQPRR